jgi:hypothetical protein
VKIEDVRAMGEIPLLIQQEPPAYKKIGALDGAGNLKRMTF